MRSSSGLSVMMIRGVGDGRRFATGFVLQRGDIITFPIGGKTNEKIDRGDARTSPVFTVAPPYRLIAILSCFMPLSAFMPLPRVSPDAVKIGLAVRERTEEDAREMTECERRDEPQASP